MLHIHRYLPLHTDMMTDPTKCCLKLKYFAQSWESSFHNLSLRSTRNQSAVFSSIFFEMKLKWNQGADFEIFPRGSCSPAWRQLQLLFRG